MAPHECQDMFAAAGYAPDCSHYPLVAVANTKKQNKKSKIKNQKKFYEIMQIVKAHLNLSKADEMRV
jgi:hypothetical protein